jgi:hypothetical protein
MHLVISMSIIKNNCENIVAAHATPPPPVSLSQG